MMMAFWTIATKADIKRLQSLRAMLVTAANTSAILLFAAARAVDWWAVLLLAPSALIGGYIGALLGIRLPSALVRAITLALASLVTAAFFMKAYG